MDCPIEALLGARAATPAVDLPRPLLEVQFWLMGRDAMHPDGNVLERLGFEREPSPAGRAGETRYRRAEPDGDVLLWRFGLHVGGLFLHRARAPVRCGAGRASTSFTVAELGGPACGPHELVAPLRWLAHYEQEVETLVGVEHRKPADARPRIAPARPCSLHQMWVSLASVSEPGSAMAGWDFVHGAGQRESASTR